MRLCRVSVAIWLVSHQTNPMSKADLYRGKEKLEGLVILVLLWYVSHILSIGPVCPAGGPSFGVVVSPSGGSFGSPPATYHLNPSTTYPSISVSTDHLPCLSATCPFSF